ncbi:MAG: hypothetical protein PHC64_05680 [Candidatus Gastranaerophilales bacterium]|nr:hypothetical protein [Candidatus Gastranaerophilales bacterium]
MTNIKKIKLIILTAIISCGLCLGTNAAVQNNYKNHKKPVTTVQQPVAQSVVNNYELTKSLDIVANPTKYLNKRVKIRAIFDKFSTLGLDYKPAYKSSEKYITFLIKRDDVINHVVPLSEMKNFLVREEAEKYIDLKPGDQIEYSGVVFSNALGDAWISVDKFVVLTQKEKSKK